MIYLITRALSPQKVLIPTPTFCEYELSTELVGGNCTFLKTEEKDNFEVKMEKLVKNLGEIDLIFLCNPNNPTGFLLEKEKVLFLLKECKKNDVILVVDEVFNDFVKQRYLVQ